jgi:hypothetical protein
MYEFGAIYRAKHGNNLCIVLNNVGLDNRILTRVFFTVLNTRLDGRQLKAAMNIFPIAII